MKRYLCILLVLLLTLSLCACGGTNPNTDDPNSPASDQTNTPDTDQPDEGDTEKNQSDEGNAGQDIPTPATVENWEEIYTSFLSDNYDNLMNACGVGFAGIGFLDLDLDGMPELLLFDSGTANSMGVQFFDIVGGEVTCVSANIPAIGQLFGGDWLCDTVVNTQAVQDFRLMLNNESGKQYFCIESTNAAMNFQYLETVRFSGEHSVLTLESLFHAYEIYGEGPDDVMISEYTVNRQAADADAYQAAADAFAAEHTDTMFAAGGRFREDNAYPNTKDGFLNMAKDAAARFKPIV